MIITGYKYQNEADALLAKKQAADYKNFPRRDGAVTRAWVDYEYSAPDGFYFIKSIDGLSDVLGDPTTFEVTDEPTV